MKIHHVLSLGCLLMQLTLDARASDACPDEVVAAVADSAGIDTDNADEAAPVSAACKPWPYDRRTLLSVFAFKTSKDDDKLLVVAMIDTRTGRVVSSYKNTVNEDTLVHFGERSLGIDTAPYQLAKDVRAFGVRFNGDSIGNACPDAGWGDELTLFVPRGKTLRPVLQRLPMTTLLASKGCFGKIATELVYDEAKLSLSLAKTSSHGFADLIVTARINEKDENMAADGKPKNSERYTLRYDGQHYQETDSPPWWLLGFQ